MSVFRAYELARQRVLDAELNSTDEEYIAARRALREADDAIDRAVAESLRPSAEPTFARLNYFAQCDVIRQMSRAGLSDHHIAGATRRDVRVIRAILDGK